MKKEVIASLLIVTGLCILLAPIAVSIGFGLSGITTPVLTQIENPIERGAFYIALAIVAHAIFK